MIRKLPPETAPQRAVWTTWPGNPETWSACRDALERSYADLIATLARFQPVELICCDAWRPRAQHRLVEAKADVSVITFHDWPANDAWTRDHGPVFVLGSRGPEVVDFTYNAWGGKFPPWEDDDRIPRRISELRSLPRHRVPIVGEGGGLEMSPDGVLLTTESVWRNPNRNPGISPSGLERVFKDLLGAREVVWLRAGMAADDTDGHIDTLSRFVNADTVVSALPSKSDPDSPQFRENIERLSARFPTVISLPHPEPVVHNEHRLPLTYANYVVVNGGVLVPTYGQSTDEEALGILRDLFADRAVAGVPSAVFMREGGAAHCLTLNEWSPAPASQLV